MFRHTRPKPVLVLSVESEQMKMKEHLHNAFVYVTTESALGYKLYFPIRSYCALVFAFWLWICKADSQKAHLTRRLKPRTFSL